MSDASLHTAGFHCRASVGALGGLIRKNDICVSHHPWGVRKVADAQHGFVLPLDESKIPRTAPRIQNENSRSLVNKADRQSPIVGPAIVPEVTVKTAMPLPLRVIDEIKPNIFSKQVTYTVEITRVEAFDIEPKP